MAKRESGEFISELVDQFGAATIAVVLDTIKRLGFQYATQAGITISKNDIVIPSEQGGDPRPATRSVSPRSRPQYERGLITEAERHESIVNIWTEATDTVADAMEKTLYELNPVYMMANSGSARIVQADPTARRHARPDGQPEGRDHRAPDQGQLHGGPVGARVLHLHARRPQGPRRHRAPHRRLRLPHPPPRRRRAGRHRPRAGLRDRGLHRGAHLPPGRPQPLGRRPHHRARHVSRCSPAASPASPSWPRRARS